MSRLPAIVTLLILSAPVSADLPLLDGNLDVRPYVSAAPSEFSADLLLQLPAQVDGWAPVPLRVRVLQQGVESIRLLTDEQEPVELARFELGPGVRPDLATRYQSHGESGILAMVQTADRVLAKRRSYVTVAAFERPEAQPDAQITEPPALRLSARRDAQGITVVELDGTLPLVEAVQHPELLRNAGPAVTGFELFDNQQQLLVRAELSDALALRPFLRLVLEGQAVGDQLLLRWRNRSGESGELGATVEAS